MNQDNSLIKKYQQVIVIFIGYVLVASLGYALGHMSKPADNPPEITVEEVFSLPLNYTENIKGAQTSAVSGAQTAGVCAGKIKGSSSGIYHVPGGAFYDRTTKPTRCFNSESEAVAAGFRKSSR